MLDTTQAPSLHLTAWHAVLASVRPYWRHLRKFVYNPRDDHSKPHCASAESVTVGYSAKAVANHFLSRYGKHGISPLKIQKLVYIAHGWHLALHGEPLVEDEYAEAWEYGPVFASLYHEFKHRGRLPIAELASELDIDMNKLRPRIPASDKDMHDFLDEIWEAYGDYSGFQLSSMCHQPGSPWAEARERSSGRKNVNIDDSIIKEHYEEKLERNRQHNG